MQKQQCPTRGQSAGGRGFNSKSTATEAQHQRILELLASCPHNTEELRQAGVFQVSARIKELREQGYDIRTERISLWDRDGFEHKRVALYSLGVPK